MSNLPLYNNLTPNDLLNTVSKNHGLYFNKHLGMWKDNWSLDGESKLKWVNLFSDRELGNATQITEHLARREALLNSHQSEALYFKTNAALVAGLGNSHPIENGLTWHHTLGVPYIPASSVKGLVREWLESWLIVDNKEFEKLSEAEQVNQKDFIKDLQRIFGSLKKSEATSVGTVIFHDAIPAKPIKLKAEIMTPHYSAYYENGEVPGDWLSPNPIPFLAVDEGQVFQFGIMPRTQSDKDKEDCTFVTEWLSDALEMLGIGAKTATGYGQYEDIDVDDAELITIKEKIEQIYNDQEEAIAQATLSVNLLTLRDFENERDPNTLDGILKPLLEILINKEEVWQANEIEELKKLVQDFIDSNRLGMRKSQIKRLLGEL